MTTLSIEPPNDTLGIVSIQRLDAGASTSYFVLQFQRDLVAAQSNEISSLAAYQKAKAALERVSGEILEDYHVEIGAAIGRQESNH